MANTKLTFLGTNRSKTNENELELWVNAYNEIFLTLETEEGVSHICLDKSTSIKLSKTLRTEINKIES